MTDGIKNFVGVLQMHYSECIKIVLQTPTPTGYQVPKSTGYKALF